MGKVSEWFWRFLAAVMLFAVGWSIWIFYQLSAPPLVTGAAFEAAAKARATQSASGRIVPAPKPAEPPVNVEKLKLSDTITAPDPGDAQSK
jgi:hypothetical protein